MVEVYSYPLLVRFGETNIPRLEIMLVKYFSSEKSAGGDCEIEYENGSSTAVLRFRREEDQKNVLAKESHQISLKKGVLKLTVCLPTEEKSSQEVQLDKNNMKSVEKNEEATVNWFSKYFERALYGKEKPSLKLPAAISEPIDSAILRYLAKNKSAAQTICSEMEKHFCIVKLHQTTVTLSPVSSLLKQKDAKAIIKEWTDTVKSAFAQSVSKFKSVKFNPGSDAWKESEKKIREMLLNENVIVVPDKNRGALSVAGPVSDVNRLEKSLSEIINKIHREKSSKTKEIKVSPSVFHLLCQDGLMDKLLLVYPELKLSPESPNLKITGLGEEINAAINATFDAVLALKRQNLEIDKNVLELLKDEQQEELTDALLTSHQINAAFEISGNRVQLLAVSDTDLSHAQDHLGQLLTTQYINVEDSNVLKKPEWQQLVSHLEQANSKPCRTRINTTAQQVVVSGYKDSAIKVQHQLGDFLTQNAHIEETVVVKANAVVEYLKHFNTSWMEKVKDKVRVSYRNEAICLSGSRVNVTHCKTVVEGAVSAVVFDSLNVFKSEVKKLFQENEALYVSSIKTKTGCLVQLVDRPVLQPTGSDQYLYHIQSKEGLDILLTKGNIEATMTEVIVNSVPPNLNLNRGAVSKAILRAAGPKLQQSINAQGATGNVGEIIVTEGCQLKNKKVFHTVAPHWDNGQCTSEKCLQGIFMDCLDMAENNNLTSISLPAIGTGDLCFPTAVVASLMLDKILEFSKKRKPKHLKKVHIVLYPSDRQCIQAFTDEFKKFPNASGRPFSKLTSTSDMHETKMGNVTIQIVTGDITKETTDIIVNSSNESFSLKSGVSKAILDAAGEAVEEECHNVGAKSNPGMIMTQPGNLKCKKILHVVGESDPVKINKVVKDALQMCVKSSYTSVSFPAIGTGQGNVKARLVADAMLDAVIDVLSQNSFGPLTTIRIVIFQKAMLKDFHSSLEQRAATDPNPKEKRKGAWRGICKIKEMFMGGNTDATCFHICGDTQADVKLAKKLIQKLQTIKIEDNTEMLSRKKDDGIPGHWELMPATPCQVFAIQANTSEYDEILKLFQASCNQTVDVKKIERIQNPGLWKCLQIKKRDLELRNGHQNNERRLFHGTCNTNVPNINKRGFNRSYAGKNAASYGNGTYFAVNVSYSASNTYSKPNQNGEKFIYVCRVLTGDFTVGKQGMIEPPVKGPASTDLYDSVVDKTPNPTMFVVFHDAQAYPEYLITFKRIR
ncbi:protein mono-ADP-ribosyltransferase PARP14-like isoform X2 [Simochromis diagramma]|uniref:protein mono-ADP-ribosyltransferase PARP14-like isoform X2 n=1 Tax=Simochromis diagramma TaxID=43689 RepID=UPI001A7EAF75|nr:protein mono-ADP-ribosyltransferase PARP14-like isoform X2 [Simochromis diagramma]